MPLFLSCPRGRRHVMCHNTFFALSRYHARLLAKFPRQLLRDLLILGNDQRLKPHSYVGRSVSRQERGPNDSIPSRAGRNIADVLHMCVILID